MESWLNNMVRERFDVYTFDYGSTKLVFFGIVVES